MVRLSQASSQSHTHTHTLYSLYKPTNMTTVDRHLANEYQISRTEDEAVCRPTRRRLCTQQYKRVTTGVVRICSQQSVFRQQNTGCASRLRWITRPTRAVRVLPTSAVWVRAQPDHLLWPAVHHTHTYTVYHYSLLDFFTTLHQWWAKSNRDSIQVPCDLILIWFKFLTIRLKRHAIWTEISKSWLKLNTHSHYSLLSQILSSNVWFYHDW